MVTFLVILFTFAPVSLADVSSNADLLSLAVSGYDLDPAYAPATTADAWRGAITGISIKGMGIPASSYTIAPGAITISASYFAAAGDYPVTVKATGKYLDVTVNQQISGDGGDVENKLNISKVQLLNPSNNEEISSVKGQEGYRVQAQVENSGNESSDGLVIIQVRQGEGATAEDGGKVLNCVGVSSAIPATGAAVTSDYILPAGLSGKAYIDVFVWDSWDDQVPLANPNHNKSFAITN